MTLRSIRELKPKSSDLGLAQKSQSNNPSAATLVAVICRPLAKLSQGSIMNVMANAFLVGGRP
jgi:hypothetical protein